jgi:hypothetical protein
VLQFLVAGLILLLVLIGVIYLTNNFNKIKATDQSILSKSHVILLLFKVFYQALSLTND